MVVVAAAASSLLKRKTKCMRCSVIDVVVVVVVAAAVDFVDWRHVVADNFDCDAGACRVLEREMEMIDLLLYEE